MPSSSRRSLLALGLALLPSFAFGSVGSLDPTFGTNGRVITPIADGEIVAQALAIQPDGKIVVVGYANVQTSNTSYDLAVLRYNTSGALDPTFGTNGLVLVDVGGLHLQDFGHGVALQPDGKIVAVGGDGDFFVVRLTTSGVLDDFGPTGAGFVRTDIHALDEAYSVAIDSAGRIVVGGSANGFGLARYTPGGILDADFAGGGKTFARPDPSGSDYGFTMALQPDDKAIVAGMACGSPCAMGMMRFVDGGIDGAFGDPDYANLAHLNFSGSSDRIYGIGLLYDAEYILLAGQAGNDIVIARTFIDGTPDPSYGTGGATIIPFGDDRFDEGYAITVDPADQSAIIAGDTFSPNFAQASVALARVNGDGQLDPDFGAGGKIMTSFGTGRDRAYAIVRDGNRIVIAGQHDNSLLLARYLLTANTGTGSSVKADPVDETTGTSPVAITFGNVSGGGDTTLTTSTSGPAPPDGFKLGSPATYYEIETSAQFNFADVCIHYTGVSYRTESTLRLYHYVNGVWVNVTTSLDMVNDVICGRVSSFSPFVVVEEQCAVKGDIAPDGGDGKLGLADVVYAHQAAKGDVTPDEATVKCGDVAPGAKACTQPLASRTWCADPDGVLDDEDAHVLHEMISGVQLGCDACAEQPEDRRLPGDVTKDGVVDVSDVVKALQFSLALEEPDAEALLRTDVAPGERSDNTVVVTGNQSITIADVVLLLRAAVDLDRVKWPERSITIVADSSFSGAAWSVRAEGWPIWADPSGVDPSACTPDDTLGQTTSDGGWDLACVELPQDFESGDSLAVLTYRAPEAVNLDDVTTTAIVLDSSLQEDSASVVLQER